MSFMVGGFDFDEIELVDIGNSLDGIKCKACALKTGEHFCLLSTTYNFKKADSYFGDNCTNPSGRFVFKYKDSRGRKKKISDII